jgi:glycosyltransferase involved in cell wall biosynthesis
MMIFNKANRILLTHELFSQYSSNSLKIFYKKFVDVGIPVMQIHKSINDIELEQNVMHSALYIGTFYSSNRNPEYILKVFEKLFDEKEGLSITFVGASVDSIPKKYSHLLNNRIFVHNRVSKEKINEFIINSDFLINLGNKVDNQLPSKVLEYIGTGKPIINFFQISNDTSNKYLKHYANALLVNQDESVDKNVKLIINFMDNSATRRLPRNFLFGNFSEETIESVAHRIINAIE